MVASPGLSPCAVSALQQRNQAATLVERDQVVAAADVGVADEDLRHGAPAGDFDHRVALGRVQVDADILDLRDATLLQQRLGALAVRADRKSTRLNSSHSQISY